MSIFFVISCLHIKLDILWKFHDLVVSEISGEMPLSCLEEQMLLTIKIEPRWREFISLKGDAPFLVKTSPFYT